MPPTEISIPPAIITMVSPHAMTMRNALLLKRSRNCCGLRNPPPQTDIAMPYMLTNVSTVMINKRFVLEIGSLGWSR